MSRNAKHDTGDPRQSLDPIDREAHDWVVRFASGEATPADLRAGKLWCERDPAHAAAFAKASRLWDRLRRDAFDDGRRAAPEAVRRVTRRAVLGGAVAASAAAYVLVRPPLELWPTLAEWSADYRTKTGEQRSITVAETVSVEMNTQTSIAVGRLKDEGDRIELVSGEALIAKAPGAAKSLVVIAGDGRVTASDARFNIWNSSRSICVTCLAGGLAVGHRMDVVSLRPGQQVVYDHNGLGDVVTIDAGSVTAWREGKLIFHAKPLNDVIAEVNRYRPGRIILVNPQLGARLFSANFYIRNVGTVVGQIERLYGATATSLPGGIVLLS